MFTKKRIFSLILLCLIIIATPIAAAFRGEYEPEITAEMLTVTVWQIDSFEGGKGSRAQYLQNKADKCFKNQRIYAKVTLLSQEAAKDNINSGIIPDIISYGTGDLGLEKILSGKKVVNKAWCRAGYCFLSVSENADFSDISAQNCVVNAGKGNLSGAAAMLCGVGGAAKKESTSAYTEMISGKYKYLLGTQRDIFRLRTRELPFKIKPVTQFCDLFQSICILNYEKEKFKACNTFVDYLINNCGDLDKIGMFKIEGKLYSDELSCMDDIKFTTTLKGFLGSEYLSSLNTAVKNNDLNMLKTLLK